MPTIAFRAVRSRKRFFNAATGDRIKELLGQRMEEEVKPHLIDQFEEIVADWDHKVQFKGRKYIGPDSVRVAVFPTGKNKKIYEWVTKGTKPHIIEPKNAPMLVFQLGYIPHTSPGGGYGGAGRATGPTVGAMHVDHPGTKAREFEKHIRRKNENWYSRKMEVIWKWAIRRL